jgi:hypothetical protein
VVLQPFEQVAVAVAGIVSRVLVVMVEAAQVVIQGQQHLELQTQAVAVVVLFITTLQAMVVLVL